MLFFFYLLSDYWHQSCLAAHYALSTRLNRISNPVRAKKKDKVATIYCCICLCRQVSSQSSVCFVQRMRPVELFYIMSDSSKPATWAGNVHLILRIDLFATEGKLAFILTRRQFPVRLSMTINKSQGQSLPSYR